MKSQLRLAQHTETPGETVAEVWHDGVFIACVYGLEGPGVKVVSKHKLKGQGVANAFPLQELDVTVGVK